MNINIPTRPLLSNRELQVLNESLAGYSASEIAERLKVRVKTVYTYRFRAFEKLGVSTDAQLFQWYGRSLAAKHGDSIPAAAILRPGIEHLRQAA